MSRHGGGYAEGESWQTGSSIKRANMEVFVEWLLTPQSERDPQTRKDLAAMLEVTTQTLRNYEQEPWVVAQLASRRRKAFNVARVDRVIEALYDRAVDPDAGASGVSAAKILLDWTEKQTAEVSAEALRELSNEEIKGMLVEYFDKL